MTITHRKWITLAAAFVGVAGFAAQASAADALVDVTWAKANLGKPGIVFIDTRGQVDTCAATSRARSTPTTRRTAGA